MENQVKQAYIKEIQYQTKMFNNLKRWLRNLIIFSSLSLVLVISGSSVHPIFKPIGFTCMVLSVIGCVIVGLGLKNGKDNIEKLLVSIDQ